MIPLLIEKEMKLQDHIGQTALHKAILYKQKKCVKFLSEEKDTKDYSLNTELMFCAISGNTEDLNTFVH